MQDDHPDRQWDYRAWLVVCVALIVISAVGLYFYPQFDTLIQRVGALYQFDDPNAQQVLATLMIGLILLPGSMGFILGWLAMWHWPRRRARKQ